MLEPQRTPPAFEHSMGLQRELGADCRVRDAVVMVVVQPYRTSIPRYLLFEGPHPSKLLRLEQFEGGPSLIGGPSISKLLQAVHSGVEPSLGGPWLPDPLVASPRFVDGVGLDGEPLLMVRLLLSWGTHQPWDPVGGLQPVVALQLLLVL